MWFKIQIVYFYLGFRLNRKKRYNTTQLNKLRLERKKQWLKKLQHSPFYKDKTNFSIINKSIFMDKFDEINTVGITKEQAFKVANEAETSRDFSSEINGITIGLSSGTSGNKGIFLASKKERAIWVASVLDRVIGFSFKARKVAFFLRANSNLYESTKSKILSFNFFDLKEEDEVNFKRLYKLSSDILIAQPSVLMQIAKYYIEHKLSISFTQVISVAEVLEDDQRSFIESVFKLKLDQTYQCTEGFLAHTCAEGNLHFNEDWIEIEKKYIDKEQTRFHPIITDYFRIAQPVVRYELNDIIQESKKGCKCGLKTTVIKKIEGRSDDVFTFNCNNQEVVIYPDFIRRAVITSSDEIVNYSIKKYADNKFGMFLDTTKHEHDKIFNKVKENLLKVFRDNGIDFEIEIFSEELNHNRLNKFKRICNEHKK